MIKYTNMVYRTQSSPSWIKHADFIVLDLVCLTVSFVLAYWVKFDNFGFIDSASWRGLLLLLLLSNLLITLFTNPYSGVFRRRYWEDVGKGLVLAVESFLVACVAFYLLKIGEQYSREMLVTTYLVYFVLALVVKFVHKRNLLSRKTDRPKDSTLRIIVVTSSDRAEEAEALVRADDLQVHDIVGFCFVDSGREGSFRDRPTVPLGGVAQAAERLAVDEVLVLVDPAAVGPDILESMIEDGIRVSFAVSESLGVNSEVQRVGRAGVLKTLDLERYSFGSNQLLYLPIKRVFDIAFGLLGCLILVPVALVVKIALLASGDAHPIFYKQTRIGLRGKEFGLWKLRSMVWNADEVLEELLKDDQIREEWERDQKLSNDPRITPIGRFLRRTSLDELPQFFNVLKGEMSVVGPRPLVPGELEAHGGRKLYNKVKPGITGWWGCNGRSNIEYRERLELEYHYVKHCSLYLDVLCIFRTVIAVFKKDGAV